MSFVGAGARGLLRLGGVLRPQQLARLNSSSTNANANNSKRFFFGSRTFVVGATTATAVAIGATSFSVAFAAGEEEPTTKKSEGGWLSWLWGGSSSSSSSSPSTTTNGGEDPYAKFPFLKALPKVTEGVKANAPEVPPPPRRTEPAHVIVEMSTTVKEANMTRGGNTYPYWTFDDQTGPGPVIRARVGDYLEIRYTNNDSNGMAHNIDFHAVTGPGGGGPTLLAEQNETKIGIFKLLYPGAFVYHCAAAPLPIHVANGMYGLLIVDPEEGMPPVDREFYVMQSEFYTEVDPDSSSTSTPSLMCSYTNGLREDAQYVFFNGREGALTDKPLQAKQGERVRIWFANGGPNLTSSFHVIGAIFDKVYRDADLISAPGRGIQTISVPPGGATVVELNCPVPGNFTLVDHALFRVDKGCVGFLKVTGTPRPDIYGSTAPPIQCVGCKLHD